MTFPSNLRMSIAALTGAVGLLATSAVGAQTDTGAVTVNLQKPAGNAVVWVESSLNRIFPLSEPGSNGMRRLSAARNQKLSFQIGVRNATTSSLVAECTTTAPAELGIRVRRVGYVPMRHFTVGTSADELDGIGHLPGLVPDPLFPETSTTLGPYESHAFWVTVDVPTTSTPGTYEVPFDIVFPDKSRASVSATVDVRDFTIAPRKGFPVTHWWRPSSLWGHYGLEPWSDEWFAMAEKYVRNMVEHGSNVVLVNTIEFRREAFKQPNQMLTVTKSGDKYQFDYSVVRRFVRMAKDAGMEYFEWPHLWLYWGVDNPMPIYKNPGKSDEMFFSTNGGGFEPEYVDFLKQYLDSLHTFLKEEGIADKSFFHLSDEPGGNNKHYEQYRKARQILKDIAPWMKVMDALSALEYGKNGVTDIPVPQVRTAKQFLDAGIDHWVYYCCSPKGDYVNRFMDTPLTKVRMSGMLFYRLQAQGFLHWGYNYWDEIEKDNLLNPYEHGDAMAWPGIPYGDPFVVYPGEDGPNDSIRWEIFAESLQDYAMLQTAGISPNDPLLAPIVDYDEFPKDENWILQTVNTIMGEHDRAAE